MFDYNLRFANKEDADNFLKQYDDPLQYLIHHIGEIYKDDLKVFGWFVNLRSRKEIHIPSSLLVNPETPSFDFY